MDQYVTMRWRLPLIMTTMVNALFISHVNGFIGMNWGRIATQRIIPSMVVDMLLQNDIHEVKVYSTSDNVMEAFKEADIGITVTVPNEWLARLLTVEECNSWIERNLITNLANGINIKYVTVGSQPYSGMYFNQTYYDALPVLKNMVYALKHADFGGKVVKPTMNHFIDIMDDSLKPSETDFNPNKKDLIIETMRVLRDADAPITLDVFPIYNALNFTKDIEFAYFYNNSTAKFMDGEFKYNNIFEVMYDKFLCALEKNGLSGIKVFGGSIGWPTDGIQGATVANAKRFHNGLVKYFKSGKGTPRHPGPIDAYMHNFSDENKLKYTSQTRYNRHWGIYRFDGQPKFNIDFTGQDRDIKPASAKGITLMPKRWCIINEVEAAKNLTLLEDQVFIACKASDCTSTSRGGSCEDLDLYLLASYAFNMVFQTKSQKISDGACFFEGLGMIVPEDPSTDKCTFPVGIIPAEQVVNNSTGTTQMPSTFNILLLWCILPIMRMHF